MNSTVSIIMPAFNAQKTIENSIKSVMNQSYTDWELLICNDSSSDDTYNLMEKYSLLDRRIKLFNNEINLGVAQTRNRLIQLAKGSLIAFLDADDEWHKRKLEVQFNFMIQNGINFSVTNYIRKSSRFSTYMSPRNEISYQSLLKYNDIPLSTVLIKKNILEPFDAIRHEDYDLWLRLLKNGVTCYCVPNGFLAIYNVQSNSLSSNKIKSFQWHLKVLKKITQDNKLVIFKSICHYLNYQLNKKLRINK